MFLADDRKLNLVLQYEIFLADIQAKRQNEFDLRCSLYFEAVDGGHQIRTDFMGFYNGVV